MEDRLVAQYLPDSAPLRGVLQTLSPSAAIVGLAGFAGAAKLPAGALAGVGTEYDVSVGPSRRAAAEATGQQLPTQPPRRSAKEDDYEVRP
jgi:hypothetical protein